MGKCTSTYYFIARMNCYEHFTNNSDGYMERILMFIKPRNKTSHSFIFNGMDYMGALTTQAEAIRNRETQYVSERFYSAFVMDLHG